MKKDATDKQQRPPNEMPDIHFRTTAAEYHHIQRVAKAMDRSVAYLIAKIVREWIERQGGDIEKS